MRIIPRSPYVLVSYAANHCLRVPLGPLGFKPSTISSISSILFHIGAGGSASFHPPSCSLFSASSYVPQLGAFPDPLPVLPPWVYAGFPVGPVVPGLFPFGPVVF